MPFGEPQMASQPYSMRLGAKSAQELAGNRFGCASEYTHKEQRFILVDIPSHSLGPAEEEARDLLFESLIRCCCV